MTDHDTEFEANARELLVASEHDLAPELVARLADMRRDAVRVADAQTKSPIGAWAPVSALAATIFAVWIVFAAVDGTDTLSPFEDEYLAAQEMELLDELEFLAWMELQAEQANAG